MIIRATTKLLTIARIKPVKVEPAALNRLEDSYLKFLFGGKIAKAESEDYIRPVDQLKKLLSDNENSVSDLE